MSLSKINLTKMIIVMIGVLLFSIISPMYQISEAATSVDWDQGFETDASGWFDNDDYAGFGFINRVPSGTNGITSSSGSYHATMEDFGGSSAFSRFDDYSDTWTGTWVAEIDIYLDTTMPAGEGFDYSVAANGTDGLHERDFIFHTTSDTSSGNLLIGASNNTNFDPREDLDTLSNHYVVPSSGWYTYQHVFREDTGALAVDLNLIDSTDTVVFSETRFNPADTIPAIVGGNRYAWFTNVDVTGRIAVDSHSLVRTLPAITNIDTGETFTDLQTAIDDSDTLDGHTLLLSDDLSLNERVEIDKELTIDGDGYSLNPAFAFTDNTNNASLAVYADNVTIMDLTVNGAGGTSLHGINTYLCSDLLLDNVTINDNDKSGLVVNGCSVTVDAITTSGNGWHGINVDQGSGVTKQSSLTINGVSAHGDVLHIYVDNTTEDVVVDDVLSQYTITEPVFSTSDRLYMLDTDAPATPTWGTIYRGHGVIPANEIGCNGYTNTPQVTFAWNDNTETDLAGYWFGTQFNQKHQWFDAGDTVKTANMTPGNNPYYYTLIAVDNAGNESPVSDKCWLTLDQDTPDMVSGMTIWQDGDNLGCYPYVNKRTITVDWDDSTDTNFDHYDYQADDDMVAPYDFTTTVLASERTGDIRDLDGTYHYRVRAVDTAGNIGDWSDWCGVTLDRESPDAFNVSPADDTYTNGASIYQEWGSSATDVDHFVYESYNDAAGTSLRWTSTFSGTNKTATNVGEAEYWWRVKAVDMAGNESAWTDLWKITVDNTGPVLGSVVLNGQVVDPSDIRSANCEAVSNFYLISGEVDLVAALTDAVGDVSNAKYKVRKVNSSGCTISSIFSSGNVNMTNTSGDTWDDLSGFDTNGVPADGEYTIRLQTTDDSGNSSINFIDILIDNTNPAVDAGVDEGVVTDPFAHTGTASDTNGISTTVWSVVSGPGTVTIADDSALSTTFSADTDGVYEIQLEATDSLGNTSTDTFMFTWHTAPAVLGASTTGDGSESSSSATGGTGLNANVVSFTDTTGTNEEQGEVQGDQDEADDTDGEVMATTDTVAQSETGETEDGCFQILGICWYWWLLSIPVIIFIWWLVTREDEDDE